MRILNRLRANTGHMTHIASYLLIFAVLCNLIYIPTYFYMRQINRSNAIEYHQYRLNSGMHLLDSSIDSVLSMGTYVVGNISYKELLYSSNIDILTLNKMRNVVSTNLAFPYDFIANCGVTQGEKILFTTSMIYYDRDYLTYDYYFQCSAEEYPTMFSDRICALPMMHFTTTTAGEYDAVTLGYCCSSINNSYLFVHYPVDKLFSLFIDDNALKSGYAAFYYKDTLLASMGSVPEKNYQLLTKSSDTGLNFRVDVMLADSCIEENLAGFNFLTIVFLVILLLATGVWILLFSRQLAKPFNQINRALHETGQFHEDAAAKNSIDVMVSHIRMMGVALSDYGQIIREQKEQNRIHMLERAVYRGLYDESARMSFMEVFPDFPDKWQLALIQYTSEDDLIGPETTQFLLTQYFRKSFPNILLIPYSQDGLLLFFPVAGDTLAESTLKTAQTFIESAYPLSLTCTASPVYSHYSHLSEAFLQLEYKSVTPPPATPVKGFRQ